MVSVYLQEEACRMQDEQLLAEEEESNAKESDVGLWPGRGLLGQVPKVRRHRRIGRSLEEDL